MSLKFHLERVQVFEKKRRSCLSYQDQGNIFRVNLQSFMI